MHDDDLFAPLAMLQDAPTPEAGPALRSLFAAVATSPAVEPPRRLPVSKRILAGIPSKIAAGALGALLAGSVGAGALTGTMVLTSNDDDAPAVVACPPAEDEVVEVAEACDEPLADEGKTDDDVVEGDDVVADEEDEASEDGEVDEPKAAVPTDLTTVSVPTSVSEAAHTHAFDEACGNHGAYVSEFAKTGAGADCATAARGGTPVPADVVATGASADADEPGATGRAKKAATPPAKAKAAKAVSTKTDKGGR